ncbi:hypothetical protein F3Y22_tig00110549pilonHSYRG00099 [Hibiscus syriacus]|uniref:Uncharacterized protein n=1 Tax=Hibiscus syriacus TaxID=106335 RepID=A0A6A3A971_HIBSY|nr:hypothetical protein F3Y22_tig00110549pilonHSYRG00099 [Hibiscus syriacus]
MLKFRSIGGFQEGKPVKPERKRNMKPSDASMLNAADIESDLEKLKKKILEATVSSDPITDQAIEKLKQNVDQEVTRAFISMGLQEKLESLKLELSRAADNQTLNRNLKRGEKLKTEINQKIASEIKAKLEQLENAQANLSKGDPLKDLVAEAVKAKKELIEVFEVRKLGNCWGGKEKGCRCSSRTTREDFKCEERD